MISDSIVVTVVVAGGLTAAIIDLRTRRVPNSLTVALAAAGIGLAAVGAGRIALGGAIVGGLVGLAMMLPGHLLGGTGAGDVKLLAAFGTLLGPARTATAFVVMALAGGVIALCVAARRRRLGTTLGTTARLLTDTAATVGDVANPSADNQFAYAPAVAIGAVFAAWG